MFLDVRLAVSLRLRCFGELDSCALLKFSWGDLTIFMKAWMFACAYLQLICRSRLRWQINHKSRRNAQEMLSRCCLRVTRKFIGFAVLLNDFLFEDRRGFVSRRSQVMKCS